MAVINATISPVQGRNGSPFWDYMGDGSKYTVCKITIPTGKTYSQVNRVKLVHDAGSDFSANYGSRTILKVFCEQFACADVSYGCFELGYVATSQTAVLRLAGNGGSGTPSGPQDSAEMTNGQALGNGVMTATALIIYA